MQYNINVLFSSIGHIANESIDGTKPPKQEWMLHTLLFTDVAMMGRHEVRQPTGKTIGPDVSGEKKNKTCLHRMFNSLTELPVVTAFSRGGFKSGKAN